MICQNCGKKTHTLFCDDVDSEISKMICHECIGFERSTFKGFGSPTESSLGTSCSEDDPIMLKTNGEFCYQDGPFIYDIDGFIVDQLLYSKSPNEEGYDPDEEGYDPDKDPNVPF